MPNGLLVGALRTRDPVSILLVFFAGEAGLWSVCSFLRHTPRSRSVMARRTLRDMTAVLDDRHSG